MTDDLKARALRAIEESEARWSKATPGPWRTSVYQGGHDDSSVLGIDGVIVEYADQADAEAIAHAPTEAATLRGLLTEAMEALATLQLCWDTEKRHNRSLDHQSAVVSDLRRQLAEALEERDKAALWRIDAKSYKSAAFTFMGERNAVQEELDEAYRQLTGALASRDECHASHDLDAETIAGLVEDVERLTAERAEIDARDDRSIKALLLAMQEYGFDEATHSKEAWGRFLSAVRMYMEPGDQQAFDAIRNRKEPANG